MNRAHSIFEIKSFDEEQRTFEGIASTPTPDRADDIVDPMGAKFELPLTMKWNHGKGDIKDSIGWITHATPTKDGIPVKGQLAKPKDDYPQTLKDQLNECWVRIRDKMTRGLSIGFKPLEMEPIKGSYGVRHKRWEWIELSPVDIPMNAEASILTVKQYDQTPGADRESLPKVAPLEPSPPKSGTCFLLTPKGKAMASKTALESIKDLEATRAAKSARLLEVMNKSGEAGRTSEQDEGDEADTLIAELKRIDVDLTRWQAAAKVQAEQAKPVEPNLEQRTFSAPMILRSNRDQDEKFKGQNYTRIIIAKALARLETRSVVSVAMERWGKIAPTLVEIIKVGEVAGGGSGSGEWGAELVTANNRFTGDFIEYLYSRTVYDQLPLRVIPANVQIKGQDGASTGYWVGESKAIPVTTGDFSAVNLGPLKVAALAVCSNELLRDSTPAAEALVRDSLVEASSQRVDLTFLSATAAVAGVSPAGILNGLVAIAPSGTTADALRADIKSLYAPFIAAKNATGLWFVTTPSLGKSIQMMMNPLGQAEFPGMAQTGGTLAGDPLVTGDNVGTGDLILLKPSDIYRIGDTGVQVSLSQEAMVEQSTAPTGATDTPVAASAAFTSMFQEESTAIKVVRSINFAKRRASAVAFIDAGAYV